jgi:hypothetical protein
VAAIDLVAGKLNELLNGGVFPAINTVKSQMAFLTKTYSIIKIETLLWMIFVAVQVMCYKSEATTILAYLTGPIISFLDVLNPVLIAE